MHWILLSRGIKCWKCNLQLSLFRQFSVFDKHKNYIRKEIPYFRSIHINSNYVWNHYKTLGIEPNAKPEEIKSAYIKLSKLHHPDKSSGTDPKEFIKIAKAYEVLGSSKSKIEYDMQEFARSSNVNRFASGEYKLYNEAEVQKEKDNGTMNYTAKGQQENSFSERDSKDDRKLFTVSPRLRQLLSYLYSAIAFTGILLYFLSRHFKLSDKNYKSETSSPKNKS
uniref:DnaJ homolog subfamily C member 4-like n=1 Tax=Phallusia mammillata TaxID=59560 RepID=A0A6F9DB26_9ASCI|nr:dnaJ homolog subfamily C member 4-like [Phallusia mammillata]